MDRSTHWTARLIPIGVENALNFLCASEIIRRNANLWHVKELLGHEDFRSLDVYAKLTILDLKATHKKHHPREQSESTEDS